jgi:glycosyltransferase involved in cell wall biosynthesis
MNILLLMDPFIPVPPHHYGGIERVIADLADTFHARGHRISLWAGPGSRAPGDVRTFGAVGEWNTWSNVRNTLVVTGRLYAKPGAFDVVHNFGRLAYLAGVLTWSLPKVQTYMRPVNANNMRKVRALGARHLAFTAVSAAIRDTGQPGGGDWHVVYNCASPSRYVARTDVDVDHAPLVFLGRLERCKGAHSAIDVATRLGRPLVIAGNISTTPEERVYFERELQPRIDGRLVTYVGVVDDAQKNQLLGSAAAVLLPIEWEEPFPVVLPEALLCGTPVIGFRRGGVPEGIDEGRTGFVCDTVDEMAGAVRKLGQIRRADCRAEAERRFSVTVIADAYERLYRSFGPNAETP